MAELRENGFETSSGSESEMDANDGEIASTGSGECIDCLTTAIEKISTNI